MKTCCDSGRPGRLRKFGDRMVAGFLLLLVAGGLFLTMINYLSQ
jgi:hypothetical protein